MMNLNDLFSNTQESLNDIYFFLPRSQKMTADNRQPEKTSVPHTPSRREFLTKGALLAGGAMIFGIPFLTGKTRLAYAAQQSRAPQAGQYALVLDGQFVGLLKSVESGFISGNIITQQSGPNQNFLGKALGGITYEDISIHCGGNMESGFYQWIQASMNSQANQMNGTILKTDMNYQVIDEKVFQNAIITEVAFPALDGGSNAPYSFNVTFKPQQTLFQAGSGAQIPAQGQTFGGNLLSSHYRLNIQGLESACAFVTRIEPLVWKRPLVQAQTGNAYNAGAQPVETPNLVITLPASQAGPFSQWFHNFVVQGQAGNEEEKPGILELLAPDLQQVLFTISFGHLGIFRMSPVPSSGVQESLVKVEMYCETMQFAQGQIGGSSSAQQQSAPPPSPPARRRPSRRKSLPRRKTR